MAKNIVLTGLMGSGKTTVGKKIAEKLSMSFVDTDELIVKKAEKSINQIFEENGEPFFRNLETEIIKEISEKANIVISTGGGAVVKDENITNLKKNGVLFYLFATAEELFERIKDNSERPLLKTENPLETLQKILAKREKFYNNADFKVITSKKNIEDVVKEIIDLYYK